jgi:hypothetical protein
LEPPLEDIGIDGVDGGSGIDGDGGSDIGIDGDGESDIIIYNTHI